MTQNERILELLRTGPKTTAEILAEVPCVVHSRIDELRRKRGLNIVHEQIGKSGAGAHLYRLLPSLREGDDGLSGAGTGSLSRSEGGVADLGVTSSGGLASEGPVRRRHSSPGSRLVRRPAQLSLLGEAA